MKLVYICTHFLAMKKALLQDKFNTFSYTNFTLKIAIFLKFLLAKLQYMVVDTEVSHNIL